MGQVLARPIRIAVFCFDLLGLLFLPAQQSAQLAQRPGCRGISTR
jgi:hypothetical protein